MEHRLAIRGAKKQARFFKSDVRPNYVEILGESRNEKPLSTHTRAHGFMFYACGGRQTMAWQSKEASALPSGRRMTDGDDDPNQPGDLPSHAFNFNSS